MALCNRCRYYMETFDEYEGWRWKCAARYWATILPEPLMPFEIEEVIRKGECEFFHDEGVFGEVLSE